MASRKKSLEYQLALVVAAVTIFLAAIIFLLIFFGDYSWLLIITIFLAVILSGCMGVVFVNRSIKNYLLTLANLVEGIRHNDFSFRLSLVDKSGATEELSREINLLVESLQQKQLAYVESNIALDKLIEQIDIPVLVIDASGAVKNSNHFAAKLFNYEREEVIGLSVEQLKIEAFLKLSSGTIIEHQFPTQGGRWEIKSKVILSSGKKYQLLVISDISRALRLEERNAWSRIVRVIGHELNNSLTSISSLAETLLLQLNRQAESTKLSNVDKGLKMIVERGESLQRFMNAYASIAKLPPPSFDDIRLQELLRKVTSLYSDRVVLEDGKDMVLCGDPDQLQAALINLIKNALEVEAEFSEVVVRSNSKYQGVAIQIIDNGPGVANLENLFVPFYTTKNDGSGIGLILSREIAEAHGGSLNLFNRADSSGSIAEIWLPIVK